MKKTFITLSAVLFVNLVAIQVAHAAIYEGPFVAVGGGQVSGSEGKVNEDGSYKVEILTGIPNTTFEVCSVYNGGALFLAVGTTTEDGELKVIGLEGAIPAGNYEQFSFLVSADSGISDCSGTLMWVSGFTIQ